MTVAAGLLLATGVLRAWLELVGPFPGDRAAVHAFSPIHDGTSLGDQVTTLFDLIGQPFFAGSSFLVALALVRRGLGRGAAVFLVVASAGVVVNAVLKTLSGPTPLWSAERPQIPGDNFPSGHTVHVVVFAGALAWLAHARGRVDLVALAVIVIVLSGATRILGGAHLPSDVLAGVLVGVAWLLIAIAVAGRGAAGEDHATP